MKISFEFGLAVQMLLNDFFLLFLALAAICLAEQNSLDNFVRGPYEEHLCES